MVDERLNGTNNEQTELAFNDAVYGGPNGQVARHYVFKGFQDSKEFQEYMQILLEWEGENAQRLETQGSQSKSSEVEELQRTMADLISAAV